MTTTPGTTGSRDGALELDWADGRYTFRLGWGDLIRLQEARDAGPAVILARLGDGSWRMEDISAVLRLGLIGGGLTPEQALKLVRDYIESRPPLENLAFARGILGMALMGPGDEEPDPPGGAPAAPTGVTA